MDRDNHDCKTLRPELRSHRYLIDVFEGFDCPDQSPSDCNNPHWQNNHPSNYDPNTRADWQRNNLQFLCTSSCIVDQYLGLDHTSHITPAHTDDKFVGHALICGGWWMIYGWTMHGRARTDIVTRTCERTSDFVYMISDEYASHPTNRGAFRTTAFTEEVRTHFVQIPTR